jgi:hypothetical protein
LGLNEHVLRPEGEFLRFDNAENPAIHKQCIVGRAVLGGVLLDRFKVGLLWVEEGCMRDDIPA